MLYASVKGLSKSCWKLQKDQVVPHRTLAFSLLENDDSYTFLLEKFSLWFSVGD